MNNCSPCPSNPNINRKITMNTTHLTRVRRLFFRPHIPLSTSRHNARQWAKSVRHLGDKWLLAAPMNRGA